jgi:hypothetical protein
VEHHGVVAQPIGALGGQPVPGGVLPQRRHKRLTLAFDLHAEQVDDVDRREHAVEIAGDLQRAGPGGPPVDGRGEQRAGRDQRDIGAEVGWEAGAVIGGAAADVGRGFGPRGDADRPGAVVPE